MIFAIPTPTTPVSTSVVDSTPTFDPTALYLQGDTVQYLGGIYALTVGSVLSLAALSYTSVYAKGDLVGYNGGSYALERDASPALNVPLTATATMDGPPSLDLLEPNNLYSDGVPFYFPHLSGATPELVAGKDNYLFYASASTSTIYVFDRAGDVIIELASFYHANLANVVSAKVIRNTLFAYCRESPGRVAAYDITDPSAISYISQFSSTSIATADVMLEDADRSALFIAGMAGNTLVTLDGSTPSAITQLSSVTSTGALAYVKTMALDGATLVVSNLNPYEIVTFDTTDLQAVAQLQVFSSTNIPSIAGVAVAPGMAYVLLGGINSKTIVSLDISAPSSIAEVEVWYHANLPYNPSGILARNGALFAVGATPVSLPTSTTVSLSNPSAMEFVSYAQISYTVGVPAAGVYGEELVIINGSSKFFIRAAVPRIPVGNVVSGRRFFTVKTTLGYIDVVITDVSTGSTLYYGELYTVDADGQIVLAYGDGSASSSGTSRVVSIDDGKAYIFPASYSHTNGIVPATDLRDTYLNGYGFTYLYPTRDMLPYDTKQYTSVVEPGTQTWVTQPDRSFQGVALGRVTGDTVSVVFKDAIGAVVATVSNYAIPCLIGPIFDPEPTTVMLYATVGGVLQTIPAGGKIEVTITGASGTELGAIFPFQAYEVGITDLSFSHDIKNFDRDRVSEISGVVDHIKGNRYSVHNGAFHIQMADYDKMVLLNKKISREFIGIDGSDTLGNEVADGVGRFNSTKLIGRIEKLGMASKAKDGRIPDMVPVTLIFTEAV